MAGVGAETANEMVTDDCAGRTTGTETGWDGVIDWRAELAALTEFMAS